MTATPASELGKTFDCKTPGCDGEARSANGRHSYCSNCQIRRGTRRADGSLVMERVPSSPGSRSSRDLFNGQHGPFETKAAELVRAAREVDGILGEIAAYQQKIAELKARLPEAHALWRAAVEHVGEPNGAEPRST